MLTSLFTAPPEFMIEIEWSCSMTARTTTYTTTLQRLEAVANALNVPVWRLFTTDSKPEIYGTVVFKDEVHIIRSKQDVIALAEMISK